MAKKFILKKQMVSVVTTHKDGIMVTDTGVQVNKKVKDSLFRVLFGENKDNALSLYNAVNHTAYTNADDLEFTTLSDVIYMKMKNDVSFLLSTTLNLYEHQSTFNPNMPLRGLLYFADLYRKLIKDCENLYGKKLIHIPNPKYLVFYNGNENDMPEETLELRLSDAFEHPDSSGRYEWTATMININASHNSELMEKCRILYEYSVFISTIKEYNKTYDLRTAVDMAVNECIQNNILKEFLLQHRREVLNMTLTEFDEAKYEQIIRAEGREEGFIEGALKNAVENIFSLLEDLGTIPLNLKDTICNERDMEKLKVWHKLAARAHDINEFIEKAGI